MQSPSAPTSLYSTANLNIWLNLARGQVAGEARCIRYMGTISTVVGQRAYNFSSINTGVSATNGIQGAIHIRSITYNVGDGQQWIYARPWEWFMFYHLNNPVPQNGAPVDWAQFGQGSAGSGTGSGATGSFYLDPPPDFIYTLNLDLVCYPIALVDNSTVEAIPYLWTDAVPFFAAYYALLSAQTNARQADAQRYFQYYQTFMQRARDSANADVNPGMYSQATDPSVINKLGITPPRASQGGG